ncbi:putative Ig domain-containing protein, partial [Spirosoma spitsbergense]|uniref:putative Ig domain-containing protein n=1 Tax=Spirosoma spitsbergense TaxID=431554 RepID=UPI0003757E61
VLTCSQTSLTLTAGGGNVYAFSPNVASQSGNMAVVNASGVYSVTVTNTATGCASTTSITISQDNTALSASLVSSGNLSCAVTSVTLTASPNEQTYTFSTGATQIGSTNQATVSTAGMYSVTVLAGNGCSSVASVTVSQNNNAPSVSILANPSLTITQGQSATLTASVSGGTPPFGYGWSTTESTSAIVVSTPGPYSVTVTGANGCSATSSVTVTVNPVVSLPFAITGVTTVSCTPILPNRFSLSFDPRYQGLNGQPVSFSVTNELFPTTAPGPYTLQLYTDNPIITLEAAQSGVATRYSYNWLDACRNTNTPNTPPRVVSGIPSQTATVGQYFSYVIPEGTFTDDETPTSLRFSATGLPPGLGFSVATLSGTPSTTVGSPFSVTITATDPGNLSVSTSLQLTVLPGGTTPPPTDVFSITGVTTISCTPVANRISLSFAPRYAGLNGQPIAFEVVNESIPTTAPAPYSLTLYRDNSVITLRANQTGSDGPVTFRYNWLDACSNLGQANTPPRLNEPVASQTATVGQGYNLNLSNTFTDQETPDQISLSASGLPAGLSVSGKFISGTPSVSGVSSVTLTATDGGGLSTNTSFSFTVVPAPVTPPPTAGFSITGVQTVNCEVLSAGQRRVTFSPQYAGLDGSPMSFSVLNELAPTTQPGPYVLNLYTDNPVITLSAVQSGLESRFSYGWLSACQVASPRVSAPVEVPLSITVLGNPVLGSQVDVDVRGAQGQELSLAVVDERGYVVSKLTQPVTAPVERLRVWLGTDAGVYYLQAQTATGSHTVKLVKQ